MSDQTPIDWDPDSGEIAKDQVAAYDEMRQRCPVAYSQSRGWSVFRHSDVMEILSDHRTFSNAVSRHLSVPNGMDPPEHTTYRRIIEPYFNPERINAFEPECRRVASELIDESAVGGNDVEVMADLATQFAVRIQCAFLGWPVELHEPLIRWTDDHHQATRKNDREALSVLARELEAIVDDLIEQRIQADAGPNQDLSASLMHETIDQRKLSNEEISSILRNWTVGEVGTIAASIGILVHHLATHADHQTTLRNDLSLLPDAIDEILRVHNPLHGNRRVTTRPVQLGDKQVGANERVEINWISANRDESVFEDAGSVRLDRDRKNNLLYGAGIHVCPGAPLARMEMRVFMEELFAKTAAIELRQNAAVVNASYPSTGYAIIPLTLRFQI